MWTSAPSAAKAWTWVSSLRRPMTSPPGGGTVTRPKRASSGPASRNDARISRASSASRSVFPIPSGSRRTAFGPTHSTSAPRSARSSTIVSTSRIRGTFVRCTSSDASVHAARIGSAPFLLPDARTTPDSGRPPSITKDCMARAMLLAVCTGSRLLREVDDPELRDVAGGLEAEDLRVERELRLERAHDVLRLAEPVPFALVQQVRVWHAALAQRAHDQLRLARRHDAVVRPLEHEHRRRDPVGEVDRAALLVEGGLLRIRADERVLVLELELVRLAAAELLEVGDAEVRRAGGEGVGERERADRRVPTRAPSRDEEAARVGPPLVDEVAGGVDTVLQVDDAPQPVQPLPIRAPVARRSAVVDVDHREPTARPVLDADVACRVRAVRRAAVAHDDERRNLPLGRLVGRVERWVEESMRREAALGREVDGLRDGEQALRRLALHALAERLHVTPVDAEAHDPGRNGRRARDDHHLRSFRDDVRRPPGVETDVEGLEPSGLGLEHAEPGEARVL